VRASCRVVLTIRRNLNEEMKLKTRVESPVTTASDGRSVQTIKEVADSRAGGVNRESKMKRRRKYANKPVGNYEYEQMIAEDANRQSRLISEAAYFISERRGFVPGNELSDWLQAETQVEGVLRAADIERRKGSISDRRGEAS
jgi:hypothetical protein